MRHAVLLRGINLGPRNRIAMPSLRETLEQSGLSDVRTYLQSGNAVVSSKLRGEELARHCEQLIAERFGLDIDVVVRSGDELAAVVERDPLHDVVVEPKRYQVTFLDRRLPSAQVTAL